MILKNAVAYITRKKNRTFIIFIVLVLILSSLYSCLSIMGLNNSVEKNLYKLSNSAISVMLNSEQNFNIDKFKNINNIKGIEEKYFQYDGVGKLVNYKVVESEQGVSRDDVPEDLKNLVSISAFNNMKKNNLFSSGVFSIKSGRNIENGDTNKVIIHEDLALKNGLKIGDKIKLKLEKNEDEFEIVGLFTGKKQEKFNGLSSDFSENMMFTDYTTMAQIFGKKKLVTSLKILVSDSEKLAALKAEMNKKSVQSEDYEISKEENQFSGMVESLDMVKQMISVMIMAVIGAGIIVLSLVLILWVRERMYEIGILLAIGCSKMKIVGQFILELVFVSLPAMILAAILGRVFMGWILGAVSRKESLDNLDLSSFMTDGGGMDIFAMSYGLLILIIVLAVLVASWMILVKKPKEILAKIS